MKTISKYVFEGLLGNVGVGKDAMIQQWLKEHKSAFVGLYNKISINKKGQIEITNHISSIVFNCNSLTNYSGKLPPFISFAVCKQKCIFTGNLDDWRGMPTKMDGLSLACIQKHLPKNLKVELNRSLDAGDIEMVSDTMDVVFWGSGESKIIWQKLKSISEFAKMNIKSKYKYPISFEIDESNASKELIRKFKDCELDRMIPYDRQDELNKLFKNIETPELWLTCFDKNYIYFVRKGELWYKKSRRHGTFE